MRALILSIALAIGSLPAMAQMLPPARQLQAVSDPGMVVMDRGSQLEVLPLKRAQAVTDPARRMLVHRVFAAAPESAISARHLGVVFNHSRQEQGYFSGEIVFKPRSGVRLGHLDAAAYPGFRRIVKPDVYAVYARTPAEFLDTLKRLQGRSDLEWVEPTITYGPQQ